MVNEDVHVASRTLRETVPATEKSRWAKPLEMKGTAYLYTSSKKLYKLQEARISNANCFPECGIQAGILQGEITSRLSVFERLGLF